MATQEISDFTGLAGDNVGTFVDVLRYNSALAQLTSAAGGQVIPNVDFRDHKLPIVTRTTLPKKYAEGATRTSASSATSTAALNVSIYEDWNPISVEYERTQDPANVVQAAVGASVSLFPLVFDIEYLGNIANGANKNTDVEFDAADPITSFSSLMANYDATSYGASGMFLTRAGTRKLGLALDTQKRLQFPNGVQSLFSGPMVETGATGTQLGEATVLAVVGPFHAGAWAANRGMESERRPDATVDSQGPGTGMIQYLNRAAMGYANGIDYDNTGRGFTCLIDAV